MDLVAIRTCRDSWKHHTVSSQWIDRHEFLSSPRFRTHSQFETTHKIDYQPHKKERTDSRQPNAQNHIQIDVSSEKNKKNKITRIWREQKRKASTQNFLEGCATVTDKSHNETVSGTRDNQFITAKPRKVSIFSKEKRLNTDIKRTRRSETSRRKTPRMPIGNAGEEHLRVRSGHRHQGKQ